ncbi:MAG: hypothetical protein WCV50_05385 [Patescibacteria group bacterium]|jgi:hypothetical protein
MDTTPKFSTYREVLKKAFTVVKQHRFLWFFGFFAAFLSAGGEFQSVFKNYSGLAEKTDNIFSWNSLIQGGLLSSLADNLKAFFSSYPWQAFFMLLMFVVLLIVIIWLSIISQIALFDSANKINKGKKISYADGYQSGNKYFSKVLLINIVIKVIMYGLFIVLSAPLVASFLGGNNILGGLFFVFLIFFIYVPISVIISFIIKYAVAYIVIQGKQAGESVKMGWELFKKNWLISVEMAFVILVIGVGVGLVILLALGISAIPFILISSAALLLGWGGVFAAATIIGVIVWFVIIAIIGSAYVSYQYVAWTLIFLKLVDEKAESKLKRWFGALTAKKV